MSFIINPYRYAAFSPADIANLYGWWRGDDVTVSNTDKVDSWNDKSGNGRDLIGTTTARPTLLTAELNGHDVLDFDGSNDVVKLLSLSYSSPYHFFAVFRQNTWAASQRMFYFNTTDFIKQAEASTPTIQWQNDASNKVSPTLSTWFSLSAVNDGASGSLALNDGSPVTANSGNTTGDRMEIGSGAGANAADISVAEAVLYSSEITGADLTNLLGYFNDRYSLY